MKYLLCLFSCAAMDTRDADGRSGVTGGITYELPEGYAK